MVNKPFKAPYLSIQIPVYRDCQAKNIVYVKGRRAGGTYGAASKILRRCIETKEKPENFLWVDTVHRNINKYVKRIFLPLLKQLPRSQYKWNGSDMTLTFQGSIIDFGSYQRPELMEGFGYDWIYVNEAGITLWDEEFFYNSLQPMGIEGKGARFVFIGAPKGDNLFKVFFDLGDKEHPTYDPEWSSFRHTSYDSPIPNSEFLDKLRERVPELTFRQEYMAEFLEDAGYFSGLAKLFIGTKQDKPEPASSYVIGVDLAKEVDFTVCWVGRMDTREGVYCERYNKIPWPEQVKRIKALSQKFANAHCIIDATGFGGSVAVDDLQAADVPAESFIFTNASKSEILSDLSMDIEQGRIKCYLHRETQMEMRSLQRKMLPSGLWRIEAPSGMHDDCVMSFALMNYGFGRPLISGGFITGESQVSRAGL